ncbi:right-handed parallel beta-helix repeat-containing protein [Novosphingobium mangrovi (ex Huang et al. 2023)]|uniref:Right-handed parallel beta-helix repeat-containing protein n=1 Tax=Novosphingobium mangrovi (ex Huang et al. 2023) TaxID=2976432 RepID=A0ABT2HZH7_9SPHN|nr:right-handed parallel beta-helix repeat-containing protein [Novosphingobium mangrovi (ex Huang et al. 2023)]MCT2397950.1 right-handed parallel beta-helix repeat-containing protein [Novosphingobium mangrovi (ex Huang et al. 2023)]
MTRFDRLALTCAALLFTALPAMHPMARSPSGPMPYTVVETGRGYARLQDAVDAIGNGRGTIRFASMRFADCAVQTGGDVTYEAAIPGRSVLDGVACENKGALVLRGRSARVQGLVFANIRVPDKNGAGIRLEHGNLAIAQAWFRDSEQGILTGNDPASTIAIDKSTFTRLGTCEGSGCAHSIYIGNYGALTVTRSRFEAGTGGHYVKTRAARVAILNCSFDDSRGRATNYMIDLSDGATGRIAGNWFVQGRDKENYSAFIAVAAEHRNHPSGGLVVEGNNARFAPGLDRRSAFVADWSGDAVRLGENALGPGLVRYEKR